MVNPEFAVLVTNVANVKGFSKCYVFVVSRWRTYIEDFPVLRVYVQLEAEKIIRIKIILTVLRNKWNNDNMTSYSRKLTCREKLTRRKLTRLKNFNFTFSEKCKKRKRKTKIETNIKEKWDKDCFMLRPYMFKHIWFWMKTYHEFGFPTQEVNTQEVSKNWEF